MRVNDRLDNLRNMALCQFAPAVRQREAKQALHQGISTDDGMLAFKPFKDDGVDSLLELPLENGLQPPFKPANDLQRTLLLHGKPDDTLDHLGAMPAFINIDDDGSASVGGPMQSVKSPDAISQNKKARDLLGALFFELL